MAVDDLGKDSGPRNLEKLEVSVEASEAKNER